MIGVLLTSTSLAAGQDVSTPLVAADSTVVDLPEALLEDIVEDAEMGDGAELVELLHDLFERPLDVNSATASALAPVPGLSPRLAHAIIEHRYHHGPFRSVSGLLDVEGMTPSAFEDARPYLTAAAPAAGQRATRYHPVPSVRALRANMRVDVLQRVQRRLERGRGYESVPDSVRGTADEPRRYLGSPERVYARVRISSGRTFSANLTLEKDPGEQFLWDPGAGYYGFDFVSYHVAASGIGRIEALVVGDFVTEFGQGVTLWRASGFGKGRDAVGTIARRGRGVRPYASTDENRFFRGIGTTVAIIPSLYVSAFASRRHLDARFAEFDTTALTVAGMPGSGLHRTRTELAQRHDLGQSLVGGALEMKAKSWTAGAVGYAASFDHPIVPGSQPYQRFHFSGRAMTMAGIFGDLHLGDYYVFAEVARSPAGAIGGLGGLEGALGPLEALLVARHYPRDFNSFHGYAFGARNGATENETGVYLGVRVRPASRWTVSAYVDQYRFPWVRFTVPRPSTGRDALLFVEHRARPWLTVYLQGRTQTRDVRSVITSPTGSNLDGLEKATRQTLRLQAEHIASRALRFRYRIEGSRYLAHGEAPRTGIVLFHDARWRVSRALLVDARLTHFDTDSFDARLYQFENDLTGVLTNTLLSGRGMRAYVVLGLTPPGRLRGIDARLKVALTHFRDRQTVGSDLDLIESDTVRDVGLQIRYRF